MAPTRSLHLLRSVGRDANTSLSVNSTNNIDSVRIKIKDAFISSYKPNDKYLPEKYKEIRLINVYSIKRRLTKFSVFSLLYIYGVGIFKYLEHIRLYTIARNLGLSILGYILNL